MQVVGCSVDSKYTHLAFINTPRTKGGLGGCAYPLLSDLSKQIAKDYGVLIEEGGDAGVTLR
jgi:alkyl hydroperoxide reductase subunit AhpC